jgi:hypothetical protein
MKKQLLIVFCLAVLAFAVACARRPTTSTRHLSSPQRISSQDANASEPAVATAKDGTAYLVWVEHRGKEADVMLKRVNAEGQTLGEPVTINPQTGQATAWRGDPPTVAIAQDGTVYVGWTGRADPASRIPPDIYLSASRDGGKSFTAPVKVNDDPKPTDHGMHSLAVAGDGRIYVAWLDERNVAPAPAKDMKIDAKSSGHHMENNRELFISSSTDGGRSFSPNQSVAADVCPCCKTNLAVGNDGRVYVSWRQVLPGDYRHIAVTSSSDQGKTFAQATIVSNDEWVLKGCPVSGAALAAMDGTLRVLWYAGGDKGQRGIYVSESQDAGQTFSPRQLLAAGSAHGTPVLLREFVGAATGVWQEGEGDKAQVLAAQFGNDGKAKDQITVARAGELPAAVTTDKRVFILYVAQEGDKQSVWLVTADNRVKLDAGV